MNHFYPSAFPGADDSLMSGSSHIPPPPGFEENRHHKLFRRLRGFTTRIKNIRALQRISWIVTLRPLREYRRRHSQVNVANFPARSENFNDLRALYGSPKRDSFLTGKMYVRNGEGDDLDAQSLSGSEAEDEDRGDQTEAEHGLEEKENTFDPNVLKKLEQKLLVSDARASLANLDALLDSVSAVNTGIMELEYDYCLQKSLPSCSSLRSADSKLSKELNSHVQFSEVVSLFVY